MTANSTVKNPLSKTERSPKDVTFRLTDRDLAIFEALNRYRYLKTSQIHRLIFSENNSMQSVRRRLKYLYHHKYMERVVPYIQIGSGMPETAYFLDREGVDHLNRKDTPARLWRKASKVKLQFLQHALDLSEFRLNLETSLQGHKNLSIDKFVADFEIKSEAKGKDRYKLYSELIHNTNRKSYVVCPDALIVLKWEDENSTEKSLYFVEIDRGTEGLERIRDKIIGYSLYAKKMMYKNYVLLNQKNPFKVLIQTNSERRAKNIRATLVDQENSSLVWVSDKEKVTSESLLYNPIWLDFENNLRSIIK